MLSINCATGVHRPTYRVSWCRTITASSISTKCWLIVLLGLLKKWRKWFKYPDLRVDLPQFTSLGPKYNSNIYAVSYDRYFF